MIDSICLLKNAIMYDMTTVPKQEMNSQGTHIKNLKKNRMVTSCPKFRLSENKLSEKKTVRKKAVKKISCRKISCKKNKVSENKVSENKLHS